MNQLFFKLRPAILAIETIDAKGDYAIGTGFHIGDGFVITARHVVDGMQSVNLVSRYAQQGAVHQIVFAKNQLADIAVLRTDLDFSYFREKTHVDGMRYRKIDHLVLGVEWDDFADESLVLHDVLVMGFPPIPTAQPAIVTIRAQVNAIIDRFTFGRQQQPPAYVLSGIPRGGFSGAPVVVDAGGDSVVLGVVTSALVSNYGIPETGFMTAVTIESVLQLLCENEIYPGENALAVKAFASELTPEEESRFLQG